MKLHRCSSIAGWVLAAAGLFLGACAAPPVNPSFSIGVDEAKAAMTAMREAPAKAARPVVVLGGFYDPGLGSGWVAAQLQKVLEAEQVISLQFFFCASFDACREKTIAAVDAAWASDDPIWTTEVDVVGLSMGGLVARHAAAPAASASSPRRLRIARLFTISSPHRGARLAALPEILPFMRDMRPTSSFLRRLRRVEGNCGYEIYPYVRLNDIIVGTANSAPYGAEPLWVGSRPFQPSHLSAPNDPRILADISRRLRGEPAFATSPAAPLPERG